MLRCERRDGTARERKGNVLYGVARAAMKVRVSRAGRFVRCRRSTGYGNFGDQTEIAQTFESAIDGSQSNARATSERLSVNFCRRKVASASTFLNEVVYQPVVFGQRRLHIDAVPSRRYSA